MGNYLQEGKKKKLLYVLSGIVLFNLMPAIANLLIGTFLYAPLLYIYSWPGILAEDVFNFGGSIYVTGIPFWTIIGVVAGLVAFRLKTFPTHFDSC
jgi:hypothetical protein